MTSKLVKIATFKHATSQEGVNRAMIDDLEETIRLSSSDPFNDFKAKMECFEKQEFEITGLFKVHNTPLLHCAVAAGSEKVVEELVKLGASECNFNLVLHIYRP